MGEGTTASILLRSISQNSLVHVLQALGIREGDCVMLHSSLSSLGWVEGGADTVVAAFLDAMGPGWTAPDPRIHRGSLGRAPVLPRLPTSIGTILALTLSFSVEKEGAS